MSEIVFLAAMYLLGGLVYNVIMVIILTAGLIAAKMKKSYTGYFFFGGILQGIAIISPVLYHRADFVQLCSNLFWYILLLVFFWKKAQELYYR